MVGRLQFLCKRIVDFHYQHLTHHYNPNSDFWMGIYRPDNSWARRWNHGRNPGQNGATRGKINFRPKRDQTSEIIHICSCRSCSFQCSLLYLLLCWLSFQFLDQYFWYHHSHTSTITLNLELFANHQVLPKVPQPEFQNSEKVIPILFCFRFCLLFNVDCINYCEYLLSREQS